MIIGHARGKAISSSSFGTESNPREYRILPDYFNYIFMLIFVFNHVVRIIAVAQTSTSCHFSCSPGSEAQMMSMGGVEA